MPSGSTMVLRGRVLDVDHAGGGGWFGEPLGVLPWPPMPMRMKWRLAVQSVYETVARGLGANLRVPRSEDDPFRLLWPVPDAQVHLDATGKTIAAEFHNPDGTTVLAMSPIDWAGPPTEPTHRVWVLGDDSDCPPRHFKPTPGGP
jgi:hypothetical protein